MLDQYFEAIILNVRDSHFSFICHCIKFRCNRLNKPAINTEYMFDFIIIEIVNRVFAYRMSVRLSVSILEKWLKDK